MKKNILLLLLIILSLSIYGQDSTRVDSATNKEGYKHWTKYHTSLRLGIGYQKTFYSELGLARHKFIYNDLGYASSTYYTSIEWIPTILPNKPKNMYGLKVGYEINARTLALGVEAKYQTDFVKNNIVFTPKVGFGLLGIINLFYGYNISVIPNSFQEISKNQFSIIVNLSRKCKL